LSCYRGRRATISRALSVQELHLFAYLACLLALFEGRPLADWGYRFALTSQGYPFSAEFEAVRQTLVNARLLHHALDDTVSVDARSAAEPQDLASLSSFAERGRWLRASMDCALALPVGSIRYALTARTDLAVSQGTGRSLAMVTPAYVERVRDERRLVGEALGGVTFDLLAPAVAWLSLYVLRAKELAG
jgi:hypothetical protein